MITRRELLFGAAASAYLALPGAAGARGKKVFRQRRDRLGRTLWMRLDSAPFPCKGFPYTDRTVVVFVPARWRPPKDGGADVLVYFHGHRGRAGRALERTGWCTNSRRIAEKVGVDCKNKTLPKEKWHRHINLVGGRAGACEQYTEELIHAILSGFVQELRDCGMWHKGEIGLVVNEDESEMMNEQDASAWDDYTGEALDPVLVKKARKEEVEWIKNFGCRTKPSGSPWMAIGGWSPSCRTQ